MSYLVLARKYRPKTFADVVGQELVIGTLRGALGEGRSGHAYLFTGPRGTGKTTTARIFAKALNCERGPTADPCGECERCRACDSGSEMDLIEIDAASHTGVDHMRDLREQAAYAPLRARFKVYLIDEVHMLSKAAFNALLKTLEEPPPHVVFLFATTELHKVLGTILSRCQVLRLEPIRSQQIAARLQKVFELEGIEAEAGVVDELAQRSMGGMRDALSLADQLLALSGGHPKLQDLKRLAGAGDQELVGLVAALLEGRAEVLLEAVAGWRGREAELLTALLEYLRIGLIGLLCGPDSPALEGDRPSILARIERSKAIGPERMEAWMRELLRARERMRLMPGLERSLLELCLLELARPELPLGLSELVERLERLEAKLAQGAPDAAARAPSKPAVAEASSHKTLEPRPRAPLAVSVPRAGTERPVPATGPVPAAVVPAAANPRAGAPARPAAEGRVPGPAPVSQAAPLPQPAAAEAAPKGTRDLFQAFIEKLRGQQPSLAELLARRGRLECPEPGRFSLVLRLLSADDLKLVGSPRNRKGLEKSFQALAGPGTQLEIDAGSQPEERPPPTPDEPFTKEVSDLFGGRIEDS